MGLYACRDDQAFKDGDTWTHDLLLFQMLASHVEKQSGFVMFKCSLKQLGLQRILIVRLKPPQSKVRENILHMSLAGFCPATVGSQGLCRHMELGRQRADHLLGSRTDLHGAEAQITHGVKLKGNAETMGIRPVRINEGMIVVRQCKVGHQVWRRDDIWKTRKPLTLCCG